MSVDFPGLLYGWLPGLYRDKDEAGELQRFLTLAAAPLEEVNASIEQLYADLFLGTCRDAFLPLIGGLLGVELDTTQPAWAQRAEVTEALASYRRKGLRDTLAAMANHLTRLHVETVGFFPGWWHRRRSCRMQSAPPSPRPACGRGAAGQRQFLLQRRSSVLPLYDFQLGRAITRQALAGNETLFAGVEGRFSIGERGSDIFCPRGCPVYRRCRRPH